ncbi:MAG: alanine--glyoxylate aminotransferase [Candidatus Poribacteria bacterium]|nr:MAG: alanine--glyoxylate aminotransferase [Candidatus Poribacteria bacterium]
MTKDYDELNPSPRLLMGPGPSNVHPRVYRAMATPLVGHLDPEFLVIMDETMELLREVFGTQNRLTIPVSATGSAGMEAALVNILEPGDQAVVCVKGVFGERMSDIVQRCGAELFRVEGEWGRIIEPEQVEAVLKRTRKPKVVAIVHAETSTGVLQPLEEIGRLAREYEALYLVDTVTSIAGAPINVDAVGIDVCYAGTQKCLSCPPGLAPITFSDRAVQVIQNRKTKVQSWYLDMTMISRYWGSERVYHHTAPVSMIYGLREALRIVHEEGLEARFRRHRYHAAALAAGLEALGVSLAAQEGYRAPMLTLARIPEGVEDRAIRSRLLNEFQLEIGSGLGVFAGKMWRIGLMGESCRRSSVLICLDALEACLRDAGHAVAPGAGVAAAEAFYAKTRPEEMPIA